MFNLHFNNSIKAMTQGNIFLLICCVFYLLWWFLAFRPQNPIKGIKTGWLLIPAVIAGIIAVYLIVKGFMSVNNLLELISSKWILIGGVVSYVLLAIITSSILKRPITTELILIVGWTMLIIKELNIFYALGLFPKVGVVALLILTFIFVIISLVCYVLYYKLDDFAAYIDGVVPLILVTVMTIVIIALTYISSTK